MRSGRSRACRGGALTALWAVAALGAGACSAGGGGSAASTRHTATDLRVAADEVVEALVSGAFLAGRDAASEPAVLMPGRVENRSSDRISRADQWAILSRVLFSEGVLETLRSKNVSVVRPDFAAWNLGVSEGGFAGGAGVDEVGVTHTMRATLSSIARAASASGGPADDRKDVFAVDYELVELSSRRVVWTARGEFARAARGLLID